LSNEYALDEFSRDELVVSGVETLYVPGKQSNTSVSETSPYGLQGVNIC
jgi:hypothetical protein